MPIVFQKKNKVENVVVWKIEESIQFFQKLLPESLRLLPSQIESRNLEYLASRHLLFILTNQENLEKTENNKPFLPGHDYHISISHTTGYAAIILSTKPCGIDIEYDADRLRKIASKFNTDEELKSLATENYRTKLYQIWCAKEAMYKAYGLGEINFKKDLWVDVDAINTGKKTFIGKLLKNETMAEYSMEYKFIDNKIHLVYGSQN